MSTLPSECEQLLVSGYVLGNLSSAEALLFEEMLAENPKLLEEVTAMQQALDLAYSPPKITPPPTLRKRISIAANTQKIEAKILNPPSDKLKTTSSKFKLPKKILWAIALALITLLGITNYHLWQKIETEQVGSETNRYTYLLRGENLPEAAVAKLVVSGERLIATLVTQNLPPLPPEKVYALWTVVDKDAPHTTDEQGAILTAVFQVDESGSLTREIVVPQVHLKPEMIDRIAITVEHISAPQAHLGSILMSTGDEL